MDTEKIIAALEGKEIDGAVITAIKALDQSGTVTRLEGELLAEQGKAKGILSDKKKYQERAEKTIQEQADSKLPAEELHLKQLQELKDQLAEGTRKQEEQLSGFNAKNRENAILKINSGIKWDLNKCPAGTAQLLTTNAFAGIDDLTDDKVSEVVKSLTEQHSHFISAAAPSGSGDKGNGGGGAGSSSNEVHTLASGTNAAWGKV